MPKRRRTVIEELHEEKQLLVSGGEDFQTCLDLFLKDMTMRNLAYYTKRWYKENLTIVKRALENLKYPAAPLHSTEKMLKDVIVYCMEQLGNNPTTINHRIRSMKQFYSFLHNESVIPINPAQFHQKQKGKKEQIKPFTDDEVKDLLDQPNRKEFVGFSDYTIMLVLLDTGVRLCELVNMKINDISLESGKILVLGKGNKEREVMFQATTREQIRRYLKIRGSVHHDYLWVAHDDKPLARKTIQDRLKKYGEMARVNKRVSPAYFLLINFFTLSSF